MIRTVEDPYTGDETYVVPPLNPDVAIVRAQRATTAGDAHMWGIVGDMVEASFAAETVILDVEEIVDEDVIRSDPNRTLIPGNVVDYVTRTPFGSHPSYVQGYYGRDNDAYLEWDEISTSHDDILAWLDEWVHGIDSWDEYVSGHESTLLDQQPSSAYAEPVNMGWYE
ncbi:MAG: CoA-transferase [Halanaeroarchaeum sp.]